MYGHFLSEDRVVRERKRAYKFPGTKQVFANHCRLRSSFSAVVLLCVLRQRAPSPTTPFFSCSHVRINLDPPARRALLLNKIKQEAIFLEWNAQKFKSLLNPCIPAALGPLARHPTLALCHLRLGFEVWALSTPAPLSPRRGLAPANACVLSSFVWRGRDTYPLAAFVSCPLLTALVGERSEQQRRRSRHLLGTSKAHLLRGPAELLRRPPPWAHGPPVAEAPDRSTCRLRRIV